MVTRRVSKPILIIQGAQYGSEAKGLVAAFYCLTRNVDYAVRTGAVNAGHTVLWDGQAVKMQQLPVGWVNPTTSLVLGAGTFIHPEILAREIELVNSLTGEDCRKRLFIDHRASLHLPQHQDQAKRDNRHHLIGATGKGCSVAITDKIRFRGSGYKLFKEWLECAGGSAPAITTHGLNFGDTQQLLHSAYDSGSQILLEGTQGSELDLHLGPYPYTTHKQTSASEWVTECGLAPSMEYETVLVARTYPIRVAGNSGPMPKETTWTNLARDINRKLMNHHLPQRVKSFALQKFEEALHETANSGQFELPLFLDGSVNFDMHKWDTGQRVRYAVALSELHATVLSRLPSDVVTELTNLFELTTVTKKLRRIAEWDPDTVKRQCLYNRAHHVVLTFWNYWYPETWGKTQPTKGKPNEEPFHWSEAQKAVIKDIEKQIDCRVAYVGTGPYWDNLIPTPGYKP